MSNPGNAAHGPPENAAATLDHLVEAPSTHAIFGLDADGEVVVWPASATRLYGYDSDEIVGESLSGLYGEDDGPERPLEDHLAVARRRGSAELAGWHERADGTAFWATLGLTPVHEDELRHYVVVASDRTDHRRQVRGLERQNDRLKEFTDILSHDMRGPLTLVDGRLDLYRETNDEVHLTVIDDTVDRMERLVDDLLRVARQGDVVTDPQDTHLGEIVQLAWEGTDDAGASLELEAVNPIRADPDRLNELLENLFRNAVEHSSTSPPSQTQGDAVEHSSTSPPSQTHEDAVEHGGPGVTVRVGPLEDGFFVEDDGEGIPAEVRGQVFDHGFTTNDDGTGYGLSVVRTIVGAHGWDVAVSEARDGGARFEMTNVDFVN